MFREKYHIAVIIIHCVMTLTNCNEIISPCPHILQYKIDETKENEWEATVNLKSTTDLSGIYLKIILDKPALQLGNWFGNITTSQDRTEYTIKRPDYYLHGNHILKLNFFIRYAQSEAPEIVKLKLNDRLLCPLSDITLNGHELISPCPRVFKYEQSAQRDRWYGTITLKPPQTLNGAWIRIILDRAAIQLGNWFGTVDTKDNKLFLIKNPKAVLKNDTAADLQFYIHFDQQFAPPRVLKILLNGRTICLDEKYVEPEMEMHMLYVSKLIERY